ncbi:MAG: glutamine amidotransferase [Polyangiaceae bacterium]
MPRPNKILVVVTGDPPDNVRERHGDYFAIMKRAIGSAWAGDFAAVDVREQAIGSLADDAALVVTGSSANVHLRDPWVIAVEEELAALVARDRPILGICFGHQLLAQALGGDVQPNPRGREVSTVEVERLSADPLLRNMGPSFRANACHSDSAVSLPNEAKLLACSEGDPHQVVRFGRLAWGVQFHPEFDGELMRAFVEARREPIEAEGLDYAALHARATDAPESQLVFRNFFRALEDD